MQNQKMTANNRSKIKSYQAMVTTTIISIPIVISSYYYNCKVYSIKLFGISA